MKKYENFKSALKNLKDIYSYCSLEAKLGPYGLYIQCCGNMHHKYKLDEI